MADRDFCPVCDDWNGEEASPSPLKSQRLVDLMEGDTLPPKAKPAIQLPPDTCAVLSVTPAGEGETVAVVMAMPDPEGGVRRVRFFLLVEQYAEMGVKTGEIPAETAEVLLEAGQLCAAIRRGTVLLGYGDQSARRLVSKLTAKGIDRATAERAAAYLSARGYIREEDTAVLRARQSLRKGWGPRRIREDLRAQGFTESAAVEALEALGGQDWVECCAAVIRKKYGEVPADRGDRQRLIAAIMRLGYDAETVREALRTVVREK